MKKPFFILIVCFLAACSGVIPYKDQNLDYLYSIQKDPSAYKGAVVAFNGEVAGIKETAAGIRLILRIDTPLYYYATGKGNSLSYEMLYVRFTKDQPRVTGISTGHKLKALGRVDGYEKRQDGLGNSVGVVRLNAVALADRKQNKDFFRPDPASAALYDSWKKGKLFFEESAEDVLRRVPAAPAPQPPAVKTAPQKATPPKPKPAPKPAPAQGIIFDEEEPPFILPPSPQKADAPKTEPEGTADSPSETKDMTENREPVPQNEPPAAQPAEPQTEGQVPPPDLHAPEEENSLIVPVLEAPAPAIPQRPAPQAPTADKHPADSSAPATRAAEERARPDGKDSSSAPAP